MKVAKLEIKVIMAMMLAGYDFDVVDVNGKRMTNLPQPDRNDIHQVCINTTIDYCNLLSLSSQLRT